MAWFNKDTQSAPETAALTAKRVAQWFDAQGLHHQLIEEHATVITGFDGLQIRVSCDNGQLLFEAGLMRPAPGERFGEGLAWANDWNQVTVFPTAIPNLNPENNLMMELYSVITLGDAGCSDEQLDLFLSTFAGATVQAADNYLENMGLADTSQ